MSKLNIKDNLIVKPMALQFEHLQGSFENTSGEFVCIDPCYDAKRINELGTIIKGMKSGSYTAIVGRFIDEFDINFHLLNAVTFKTLQIALSLDIEIDRFYIISKLFSNKNCNIGGENSLRDSFIHALVESKPFNKMALKIASDIDFHTNELDQKFFNKDGTLNFNELDLLGFFNQVFSQIDEFKHLLSFKLNVSAYSEKQFKQLIMTFLDDGPLNYLNRMMTCLINNKSNLDERVRRWVVEDLKREIDSKFIEGGFYLAKIKPNRVGTLQIKHESDSTFIGIGSYQFSEKVNNFYIDSGQVGVFQKSIYEHNFKKTTTAQMTLFEQNYDKIMKATLKTTLGGGVLADLKGAVSQSAYGDMSFDVATNIGKNGQELGTQILIKHNMFDGEDEILD